MVRALLSDLDGGVSVVAFVNHGGVQSRANSLASDAIRLRIARRRAEKEGAEAFFPLRATTK
jgi:hypothetical protein